jgi:PAS domain S-box-containing protein
MPDPSPPAPAASACIFPDGMLHDLLAVSLTAVNLLRPLYASDGSELVDFAVEYLNPAAQRMTGLPEQPNVTARARFPDLFTNGVFDFYRRVFETGEPGRYDFNYQADGFDNYFNVAARRSGDFLLVSFTDTADHPRTPVELALRASQAAEQDARAEADAQRQGLHDVLMALPAPVATFRGPTHVYELVNPSYQQLFPTRPVQGRPIRQALPELAGQGIFERLDRVYQTGEPHLDPEQETWVDLTGTGRLEKRYFSVLFQAQRDRQGRIDGILNFAYDVTEHVTARQQVETLNQELETRVAERTAQALTAAQEQLQEREKFYQVFAQAQNPICVLRGPEHRYEYVNPAYQQLFPGRELAGCSVAEALPEAAPQGFVALLDRVYQTGEPFSGIEIPLTLTPADGQPARTDFYTFIYQAYRENGQVAGISVFGENVTGQVLARQEREAQRRHLEDLFAQAPVAIAIFRGPRYVIELANPAVCAMWGRTAEQTLGTPLFELLPEAAGQGFEELLDGVMATGVPHVAHELPSLIDRDGRRETVYWNFVYQPLREGGDQITAVTVVATDVTEQVHSRERVQELNLELAFINESLQLSNEELRDTNQQLTRTNIDLDNFIYTASHDLKVPIANIEGLLFALRTELPADVAQAPKVGAILSRMLNSVDRFTRTIGHLTEVSKLQKEHDATAEANNLAGVVEDVRLDLASLFEAANAQLTVSVAEFPPVLCSEKNLRSIVYNLLSNAVKYHSPDRRPHIDVQAHVSPGHTVLEVHDNGLGIAENQLPKLFGMFQRFHTHVDGTGIGLYMVKRMVENAGGRIEVHSQLGAGTTVFVRLPHAPTTT